MEESTIAEMTASIKNLVSPKWLVLFGSYASDETDSDRSTMRICNGLLARSDLARMFIR